VAQAAKSALLKTAKELAPLVMAEAAAGEAKGALTDKVIGGLRDGGLLGLMIPRPLGGSETGPVAALEVLEAVSYADGSAGWVLMAAQCCSGTAGAFLPPATAREIFAGGIPIIAGQGAANGRAIVDGNGYRVSGRWSYGSGLLHAQYIHTGAIVFENGAPRQEPGTGHPEIRTFILPRSEATLEGNWDVMGLRATGSVDYALDDVFVPAEFTHSPHATVARQGGSLYSIGILGLTAIGHTGFALGVGRRALDELAAIARRRAAPRGALPPLADTEHFQEGFGAAEAQYRAARAFIFEAWEDVEHSIARGDPIGTRQITLYRLALNHLTSAVAQTCTFAYKEAGGIALRDSALQRCFRDIYAGTQHFLTKPHLLKECGRELAGLAEGKVWTILGLADHG
jgi:indole-3-acetate monooxygenase